MTRPPPTPPLFPYTTLFRSVSTSRACSRAKRYAAVAANVLGGSCGFSTKPTIRSSSSTSTIPYCRASPRSPRSEEHTSELQSHSDLVCRLLLEKKKKKTHKN